MNPFFFPYLVSRDITDININTLFDLFNTFFCTEFPEMSLITGGSCNKFHYCHDKTHLLLWQKYACCDKTIFLSWLAYFCCDKRCVLSWQTCLCHNNKIVAINMCLSQQKLHLWQLPPMITDRWTKQFQSTPANDNRWTKQFQSTPVTSLWWLYYAKARRNLCKPTEGQLFHLAHICGDWEEDLTHIWTVYDDTKSLLVCPWQCLLWIRPPSFVFRYIWPQPTQPPHTYTQKRRKKFLHNSVIVRSVKSKEEGDLDCDCSFWPGPNNWNLTFKSVGTMVEL